MSGIRSARSDEWKAIAELLAAASLPIDDLSAASLPMFSVWADKEMLSGIIAVERRGDSGMLRSLVVTPAARRSGLGRALVAHAEGEARALGLRSLYLLTDSAEQFFARCGYQKIDRARAPNDVRSHPQFKSLCPASAAFMHKALTP